MKKILKFFIVGFSLFLGGIIAFSFSNNLTGWSSKIINTGSNSGSLGFFGHNSSGAQNNNPTMILGQNQLDLNGKIRINDGSQGDGRVLMSDKNGLATWRSPASIAPTVVASLGEGVDIYKEQVENIHGINKYLPTGTTITIPKNSKYIVNISMLFSTINPNLSTNELCRPTPEQSIWIRSTFSTDSQCKNIDFSIFNGGSSLISGIFSSTNGVYGMLNGAVIIYNKENFDKTFYYCVGNVEYYGGANCKFHKFGGNTWAENQIYAIPIN